MNNKRATQILRVFSNLEVNKTPYSTRAGVYDDMNWIELKIPSKARTLFFTADDQEITYGVGDDDNYTEITQAQFYDRLVDLQLDISTEPEYYI